MSGCRSRQDLTFQYPCSLRFPLQAGGTEPTRPTRFPSRSGGNQAPSVPPARRLIRVQRFGTESPRQGLFPPARAWEQAQFFALTPFVPLSRLRARGNM